MKRILTITTITIVCIFGLYTYLTWGNNGNPRFMHHRYNKVVTEPLAKLGIADAQYKMGLFYIVGTTNPPSGEYDAKADLEKAIYWWEKASAKGNEKASEELAKARELLDELNNPFVNELSFMKDHIGKYPHDIDFFNIPVIRERLQNLAGEHLELIEKCGTEGPISEFENYIHIQVCFPHECHRIFCEIFINKITDNISLYHRNSDKHYFLSENGEFGIEFDRWRSQ